MESITTFLKANQLLLSLIVMPFASACVAWFAAWLSTRRVLQSEKDRRAHEAATQISVFRQKWIDDLRDTLAEFQSYGIYPNSSPSDHMDFYRLGTKIELLLNPNDPDYNELQKLMYQFLEMEGASVGERYSINPEFVSVSQRILKREWERLKAELRDPTKFMGGI